MFGEFTVPAYMHDAVYFDLVEAGFIPVDSELEVIDEVVDFDVE